MTAVEPMVPTPGEPLHPAPSAPVFPRSRTTAPMPMVRVNLLPDEVVAARRGHRTRRRVLIALAVLLVALVGVSMFVRSGIGAARGDLAVAQAVNRNLTAQQGQYADALTLRNDVDAAVGRLDDLTGGDMAWSPVTKAILDAAPAGIAVDGVVGASDSGTAGSVGGAPGGAGTPAPTGGAPTAPTAPTASTASTEPAAATVAVTGGASDPAAVATYVDALSRSPYLADVVATAVTVVETGGYSFQISAVLTPAGRSHRHATEGTR